MKLANFLQKFIAKTFDKKWVAIGVIAYVVLAVSAPQGISAVTEGTASFAPGMTPAYSALFNTYDSSTCVALGLSTEKVAGSNTKIICSTGVIRNLAAVTSKVIDGADFADWNSALDESISTSERNVRLARIFRNSSASLSGTALATTYSLSSQRPVSGVIFASDVYAKVVLPDAVYAENTEQILPYFPGTGFELLSPIRTIWGYLVGLAYSFMILLVVGVSLALMFRAKIDGGKAVELQNAIPGIVMAMVLIPLSYPISGLFIDGITLGGNVIHGFFFGPAAPFQEVYDTDLRDSGVDVQAGEVNRGLFLDDPRLNLVGLGGAYSFIGIDQLSQGVELALCRSLEGIDDVSIDCNKVLTSGTNFNLIRAVMDNGFVGFISEILAFIIGAIFSIFAFFTSLRIAWKLFVQFLTMMLLPMFSPIIFALIAIPGQGTKWVEWYGKRMGNVTANFLIAYAMILLAAVFASPAFAQLIPSDAQVKVSNYQPPMLGQLFGSVANVAGTGIQNSAEKAGSIMFLFMSVGIFAMIPGVMQQVTDSLAPKEDNPFFKLVSQEAKKTYDFGLGASQFAFRQAPAAAASAYNRIREFQLDRAKVKGAEKDDGYFGDTRAEAAVKAERLKLQKARDDVANAQGDAAKRAAERRLAQQERSSRAAVRKFGAEEQLFGKKGENPPAITASLEGFEQFGIFSQAIRFNNLTTRVFNLKVVLKVPDNTTPPIGEIYFSSKTAGIIASYNNKSQSGKPAVNLSLNGTSSSLVTGTNNVQKISGAYFSGQTKVELLVTLDFSKILDADLFGTWEPDEAVKFAVGDGKKNMVDAKLDPAAMRITFSR